MIPEDKITGIYFIIDELLGYGMSRYIYKKKKSILFSENAPSQKNNT